MVNSVSSTGRVFSQQLSEHSLLDSEEGGLLLLRSEAAAAAADLWAALLLYLDASFFILSIGGNYNSL